MAPATLAGATPRPAAGRRARWDRDAIIEAVREWAATYGEPPRAADWNPSAARWSGQPWRVERYRAGRADGSPWPALNAAKRPFGGSLTAAVVAAGLEPARPGPRRRDDVDPEQASRALMSPEGRAMVQAALAQAREAERRVASLEGRLERSEARAGRLRLELDDARRAARAAAATAVPRVVRERVVDDAAVARAERRATAAIVRAEAAASAAREDAAAARAGVAEARAAAARLAARLERSEATVGALRADRRELRGEVARTADRLVAARAEAARRERAPAVVAVRDQAPAAAELRAARADAAQARRAAREAEVRTARAERELHETVAAVRGEPRRLTAAELAELRETGPAGPAVLAEALRALTATRAACGDRTALRTALGRVARAAVAWQERL
jgi:hypothetical protein